MANFTSNTYQMKREILSFSGKFSAIIGERKVAKAYFGEKGKRFGKTYTQWRKTKNLN